MPTVQQSPRRPSDSPEILSGLDEFEAKREQEESARRGLLFLLGFGPALLLWLNLGTLLLTQLANNLRGLRDAVGW